MKQTLLAALLLAPLAALHAANKPPGTLNADGFKLPPDAFKPWVIYHIVNGNATLEGVTADLEAMRRTGIGGIYFSHIGKLLPEGKVENMSPEWSTLLGHLFAEAERQGLKAVVHNSQGWTGTAGPWIAPADSMQKMTASETMVSGPGPVNLRLERPAANENFYRDIAVFAIQSEAVSGDGAKENSVHLTSSKPGAQLERLVDGRSETGVFLDLAVPGKPQWVQMEYDHPFEARGFTVTMARRSVNFVAGELQASEDASNWRKISDFMAPSTGRITETLAVGVLDKPVCARYFRFVFLRGASMESEGHDIAELKLSSFPRNGGWPAKAGFINGQRIEPIADPHLKAAASVLDITPCMKSDGALAWEAPPGPWTILRIGHTTTGADAHPGIGKTLQTDKMRQAPQDLHFSNYVKAIEAAAGPRLGGTVTGLVVDSWEHGTQNWTTALPEEFKSRMGYSLAPYLPCLFGYIVKSPEITERFLWDFRYVLSELIIDNYFVYLDELTRKHGFPLGLITQAYLARGNYNSVKAHERAGVPMGEAAADPRAYPVARPIINLREASSAAGTQGKHLVPTEAFTSSPNGNGTRWTNHPYLLKPLLDKTFVGGQNQIMIHSYQHQPWQDRWPGMTFGGFGIQYNRNVTWFEQSRVWNEYMARCQFILQQAQFAADYIFYVGEGAPNGAWLPDFAQAPGFDFDLCSEYVVNQMTVENGGIALPSGRRYRLLVLPPTKFMTPEVLRKIRSLVAAGISILGPRPESSPSLRGYPACDGEVADLASALWGSNYKEGASGRHDFGKGAVYWGQTVSEVFAAMELSPDVAVSTSNIIWRHDRSGDDDFYFVSNQIREQAQSFEAVFRVKGRRPELWHPDTGVIEDAPVWSDNKTGGVRVSLKLEPAGSIFVVFRKDASQVDSIVAATLDGRPIGDRARIQIKDGRPMIEASQPGRYEIRFASGGVRFVDVAAPKPPALDLSGPWTLKFPPQFSYGDKLPPECRMSELISWTKHTNPAVKFFSGTGIYTTRFNYPNVGAGTRVELDLGRVEVIAEVTLNGTSLGTLWKPPFRLDVTYALKPGENLLEVRVVNLWGNRLVGDEALPPYLAFSKSGGPVKWPDWLRDGEPVPDTGRITFTTWRHWNKDEPLAPSGLLGPVVLRPMTVQTVLRP